MAVELIVLSFVCVALLAVFLPVKRVHSSIPNLAIVLWLIIYNLIHGINAAIWAGNVGIHVPVWCDIATKLMLGANIALPGAFLCIAHELETVASQRPMPSSPIVVRNRKILEVLLCYIIPVVYMLMHLVAQDHRFDLVEDLGCSASIHPSNLGVTIVWVPPLIICIITLVLSGRCIHHAFRSCTYRFSEHLSSRSTITSTQFFRRLSRGFVMTGALTVLILFDVFSIPTFSPWISWDSVHSTISQIEIPSSEEVIGTIKLAWWGVFAVTVLYILLSYSMGEETRDIYHALKDFRDRKPELPRLVLPTYHREKSTHPEMASRFSSLTKPRSRPATIELRSGWDDMLYPKSSKRKDSSKSPTPSSGCSSPTPSSRSGSAQADDEKFMASTLSYLGSPTAKALGILPPPAPAVSSPPPLHALEIPPPPTTLPPAPGKKPAAPVRKSSLRKPVPKDSSLAIAGVLDAQWPRPPTSPSPSLSTSGRSAGSRSHSPASSAEETFGYPIYPTVTPPHLHIRPFQGSSISSIGDTGSLPSPTPSTSPKPLKPALKKSTTIKALRRSWSKERMAPAFTPNDVIHMTVVQETG